MLNPGITRDILFFGIIYWHFICVKSWRTCLWYTITEIFDMSLIVQYRYVVRLLSKVDMS